MNEHRAVLRRIYQLIQLGLPYHLFIVSFLEELHTLVISYSNTYIWLDKQSNILNLYDEKYSGLIIEKLRSFFELADIEETRRIHDWLTSIEQPKIINQSHPTTGSNESLFFQPDYHQSLCLPVYASGTEIKVGILILHRRSTDLDFTATEIALLKIISEIIGLGFYSHANIKNACKNQWKEGLVTVDNQSQIQQICPMAENLVVLASQDPRSRPLESDKSIDLGRFSGLKSLVENLYQQLSNSEYSLSTNNHWGNFQITGFMMHDMIGHRAPQLCINIKWLVPIPLILFEKIQSIKLTSRQEDIALLYACGYSTPQIADKLTLSAYTVKEHLKNIFTRLQVNSQKALIEKILYGE